jgi:hypothetical protein
MLPFAQVWAIAGPTTQDQPPFAWSIFPGACERVSASVWLCMCMCVCVCVCVLQIHGHFWLALYAPRLVRNVPDCDGLRRRAAQRTAGALRLCLEPDGLGRVALLPMRGGALSCSCTLSLSLSLSLSLALSLSLSLSLLLV